MTVNRAAWSTGYNFNTEAVRMLDKYTVDDYWNWFWNRAKEIDTEKNDDFVRDLIVTVALDVERRQKNMKEVAE